MSKHSVVPARPPQEQAREVEPVRPNLPSLPFFGSFANPFVSFTYSYTEVSESGGKAHVKSRRTRLADGKLSSEAFEGEVAPGVYEQWMQSAHAQLAEQMKLFMQPFGWLLPPPRKPPRE